jgi:hypothetical protein
MWDLCYKPELTTNTVAAWEVLRSLVSFSVDVTGSLKELQDLGMNKKLYVRHV